MLTRHSMQSSCSCWTCANSMYYTDHNLLYTCCACCSIDFHATLTTGGSIDQPALRTLPQARSKQKTNWRIEFHPLHRRMVWHGKPPNTFFFLCFFHFLLYAKEHWSMHPTLLLKHSFVEIFWQTHFFTCSLLWSVEHKFQFSPHVCRRPPQVHLEWMSTLLRQRRNFVLWTRFSVDFISFNRYYDTYHLYTFCAALYQFAFKDSWGQVLETTDKTLGKRTIPCQNPDVIFLKR